MAHEVAILGVAELSVAARVDRLAPSLANMVISNLPGGRERPYVNRATMYDLPKLARQVEAAYEELERAAKKGAPRKRANSARRTTRRSARS